jgi:hypothetical protein
MTAPNGNILDARFDSETPARIVQTPVGRVWAANGREMNRRNQFFCRAIWVAVVTAALTWSEPIIWFISRLVPAVPSFAVLLGVVVLNVVAAGRIPAFGVVTSWK